MNKKCKEVTSFLLSLCFFLKKKETELHLLIITFLSSSYSLGHALAHPWFFSFFPFGIQQKSKQNAQMQMPSLFTRTIRKKIKVFYKKIYMQKRTYKNIQNNKWACALPSIYVYIS
ncbi:hypothetical protein, unlikely [Trypanosoma brucei gambiense DAL972]|uniref:Uncharacterized protein n=1 Tax=Trypanosoma brucei gambiense (strain MHOM/CI/86/DAL972) TaxID=679716 RepID=D0AAL8_TRYB9|nr:hypothetical protein, unlikely [Trypanosoma brucei gambiense DAL972]CBH18719.1 hypothetical protein, unlikely [Trypanosoma brucei gambiense DAL972]|eukprot:XP_011780983.1 hypothetical protein, unlikely [Trypanosoma brucei gambiense DAL972]